MPALSRFLSTMIAPMVLAIGASCAGGEDRPSFRGDQVITVPVFRGTACQLADVLQKAGVPVSIIQASDDPEFALDEERIQAARLFARVEKETGAYRLEWIDGHAVLYPKNLPYDREIGNVAIAGVRRLDAAGVYLKRLRETVPEIPLILGPGAARIGPPGRIPLYDDPVTLAPKARVIDHLVQLLGADRNAFFVIKKSPGLKRPVGAMIIFLGSVERP